MSCCAPKPTKPANAAAPKPPTESDGCCGSTAKAGAGPAPGAPANKSAPASDGRR